MLEAACAGGTAEIVATPHANSEYEYQRIVAEDLVHRLQQAMGDRIRIYLGCDLHLALEEVERAIAKPAEFSLNGKGYVLVEPPETLPAKTISAVCKRLSSAGLRPVLTHPERYSSWHGRERQLESWIAEGIRMQITGGSLLGHFGSAARKSAEKMVASGWVHFLASDAHDTRGRSPNLSPAYALVEERWGEPAASQFLERNPRAAITGQPVSPVTVSSRRKWLSFVR